MRHLHKNGEEIALPVVLPFVQFLVERGLGQKFCLQTLQEQPSQGQGIVHLYQVADKLPDQHRFTARNLIEGNLHKVQGLTALAA